MILDLLSSILRSPSVLVHRIGGAVWIVVLSIGGVLLLRAWDNRTRLSDWIAELVSEESEKFGVARGWVLAVALEATVILVFGGILVVLVMLVRRLLVMEEQSTTVPRPDPAQAIPRFRQEAEALLHKLQDRLNDEAPPHAEALWDRVWEAMYRTLLGAFELFGGVSAVSRASFIDPSQRPGEEDFLRIRDGVAVDRLATESRRFYVGADDSRDPRERGIAGHVYRREAESPYYCRDPNADPLYQHRGSPGVYRSYLSLAAARVSVAGTARGVVCLDSSYPAHFGQGSDDAAMQLVAEKLGELLIVYDQWQDKLGGQGQQVGRR